MRPRRRRRQILRRARPPMRDRPGHRSGRPLQRDALRRGTGMSLDTAREMAAQRRHQAFPILTAEEMARMARYGEARHFHPGDLLKKAGQTPPGLFVLMK